LPALRGITIEKSLIRQHLRAAAHTHRRRARPPKKMQGRKLWKL
jgi:hypothetical protein